MQDQTIVLNIMNDAFGSVLAVRYLLEYPWKSKLK